MASSAMADFRTLRARMEGNLGEIYHTPSGLLHLITYCSQGVALGWNIAPFQG